MRNKIVAKSERMHASGGKIEGGTPLTGNLGLASLLVRESVQNSWDARDDEQDGQVRFEIAGWDFDSDELDYLRSVLPVAGLNGFARKRVDAETPGILHPAAALERDSVRVLMISDRKTVGLCGPSRSGLEWNPVRHGQALPRGQQRFANFVRNQGRASADIGGGDGGAYGIGKSALWMTSQCGTVLIHTRTTDHKGKPVERLIGSVHGEHFYSKGREYTGRHFVGIEGDDDLIEPLTGADAAEAASKLRLPSYAIDGEQVDGTTILILAPRFTLDWATEMARFRDAVRWQVWPKLVKGVRSPNAPADLDVRLSWNNNPVVVPDPLQDPEIRPYARVLLDCARNKNDDEANRDHVAMCHKPIQELGLVKFRTAGLADENVFHRTITGSQLESAAEAQGSESETADMELPIDSPTPWGQIALIRREPLLLVKYEPIGGPDSAATEVGVFLSANDPAVEEALTKAEPPAHDDWIYKNVPKDHSRDHRRTLAKRTVDEIRAARRSLLATFRTPGSGMSGGGEQTISRTISQGLFGGLGGGRGPKARPKISSTVSNKPGAQLSLVRSDQDRDRTRHELNVKLTGLGSESRTITLTASGKGHDNVGSIDVSDHVSYSWSDEHGQVFDGPLLNLNGKDGTQLVLVVSVSGDLRFRPKVSVQVNDGN